MKRYSEYAHLFGRLSRQRFRGPALVIGAGRDALVDKFLPRGHKVVTFDIYPRRVVDAVGSVNCLPFQSGEFGCVVCTHVLEHVEDPARAVSQMHRVLRPGGLIVLAVPFVCPIHEKPYDLWRFTEEGLRCLLADRFEAFHFQSVGDPRQPRMICVTARKSASRPGRVKTPKVSVIMPTYNRARLIGRSIQSILGQTMTDWELVVVSDGSTDGTRQVVSRFRDPRIRFFHKKNGGPASARNYGLKRARGRYIAYCDDDDTLFPYHLETLSRYLDRHPEVGLVRGHGLLHQYDRVGAQQKSGFLWTSMHRSSHLKRTGLLDPRLRIAEDAEFLLRYADFYHSKQLNMLLAKYVVHENSITEVMKTEIKGYYDLLYAKRIRAVCAGEKMEKSQLFVLAYLLGQQGAFGAAMELANVLRSRRFFAASAYLAGWASFELGRFSDAERFFD